MKMLNMQMTGGNRYTLGLDKKTAIILGSAINWLDDYESVKPMLPDDYAVFAVKYAGVLWPYDLDYWVSLHVEKFAPLIDARAANGYPSAKTLFVHRNQMPRERGKWRMPEATIQPDFRWPKEDNSGSSSLYAVKCAMIEGFNRIVLCGCPLDKGAEHIEPNAKPRFGKDADRFMSGWRAAYPFIKDAVRSMSGKTADMLGTPDKRFFKE